jgi:DNA-binding CsgD family transcriptional regulator
MNHYFIDDFNFFCDNLADLLAPHGWLLFTIGKSTTVSTQLSAENIFFVDNNNKIRLSELTSRLDISNFDWKFAYLTNIEERVITEMELEVVQLYDKQQNYLGCFIVITPSYLQKAAFVGSCILMKSHAQKMKQVLSKLSTREREVFFLLVQGYTVKELTNTLNKFLNLKLSDGYIGNLVRKIYSKFDVYNHADFISAIYKLPQAYDIPQSLFESRLKYKA